MTLAEQVLALYERTGALQGGHFVLSSGLHSPRYLQSARVLQWPDEATWLGREIAAKAEGLAVQAVVAPALGGIVIAQEVARGLAVRGLFVERVDGKFTLRRGFELAPGEKVLVVEDIITTGLSTNETIGVVRDLGAVVVGAAAIIDRSGGKAVLDVPLFSLASLSIPVYAEADCPLCRGGVPATKPGSRGIRSSAAV
ncbi:MAG: orotate phosphoribosyltransferase [Nitrospirae bacterium]|nr:orotate phosphoribosyltransferase [Nitrospirota bacterium]